MSGRNTRQESYGLEAVSIMIVLLAKMRCSKTGRCWLERSKSVLPDLELQVISESLLPVSEVTSAPGSDC